MKVPYIKAIDKDTGKEVQGFYFEYPETSYCFTEDYEKSPVEMNTMCGFLHNDGLGIA